VAVSSSCWRHFSSSDLQDLPLGLGVDQVHLARPGLAEALDAVHRLDRVVEAVVDPGEHHLVGLLQVQADAEHHRLAEQDRRLAGLPLGEPRSASSVGIEPSIDDTTARRGERALERALLVVEVAVDDRLVELAGAP
jgi:hypothetical protein